MPWRGGKSGSKHMVGNLQKAGRIEMKFNRTGIEIKGVGAVAAIAAVAITVVIGAVAVAVLLG